MSWALNILLAEDHVLSQALTVRLLEAEGHIVCVVGTGRQAVDACRDQPFDVVLMDLQLPVLDGLNAIREIRESQAKSVRDRLSIWVLTADSSSEMVAKCLEAGADGHLAKPLRPKQLLARLRDVIVSEPEHKSAESESEASFEFQRTTLLENVGQDHALAKSLVELFQRDYDPLVARFRSAFVTQDFPLITREAHSLKSPARVFGAAALHCLCDDLEKIGQSTDAGLLQEIQAGFLHELQKLHEAINAF